VLITKTIFFGEIFFSCVGNVEYSGIIMPLMAQNYPQKSLHIMNKTNGSKYRSGVNGLVYSASPPLPLDATAARQTFHYVELDVLPCVGQLNSSGEFLVFVKNASMGPHLPTPHVIVWHFLEVIRNVARLVLD